ncbi:hypothetical protein BD770DRAFT_325220 [Pilaira anomala]|nr:hypothetical protein BD770DRAFT_325220 [Pilaira anomala]
MEFVPQFVIPAEPNTSWAGGQFFGKDRFVIWTLVNIFFFCIATLVRSYNLNNNRSIYSGTTITTILCNEAQQLFAAVVCNNPEASGFRILPLQGSDNVQENEPVTYAIEKTFFDVWPLVEKSDSKFGNITITAPVNTNHLAIGYESGTICVVPLSLALLHLTEISNYIEKRDDVRLFEKAHPSAITCMIVPEHHVSGQQYLLSGGQDGAVKIWNLM